MIKITRTTYSPTGHVVQQSTGDANTSSVAMLRRLDETVSMADLWAAIFSLYNQLNPAVRITVDRMDGSSVVYTQSVTPNQENNR